VATGCLGGLDALLGVATVMLWEAMTRNTKVLIRSKPEVTIGVDYVRSNAKAEMR
jgi:hypothetical protein